MHSVSTPASLPRNKPARQYYLDWLRVIAVLTLLYFHVGRIFETQDWLVKNAETSVVIEQFNFFISQWRLSLLFLVSGISTFFALGFRSAGEYTRGRMRRLLLPLAFGLVLLVPPQHYYEALRRGRFEGSLAAYYPQFFATIIETKRIKWEHLWFLEYLFIYSLVALPFFFYLKTAGGRRWLDRVARLLDRGPAIFLFGLPLVLNALVMRVIFPALSADVSGGAGSLATFVGNQWDATMFFIFFVYGYLLSTNQRFGTAMLRLKWWALGAAIIAFVALRFAPFAYEGGFYVVIHALNVWLWVMAVIGFAQVYLTNPTRFLRYATELVYPFYIIHQTIVVIVGYYVVQWDASVLVKFVVISTASIALTLLLCELVKQTNLTRLLFGLNPKRSTPDVQVGEQSLAQPHRSNPM